MGRTKIADKVKKIRGTDQPCRMSGAVDGDLVELPKAPKEFNKLEREAWQTIGGWLVRAKMLADINMIFLRPMVRDYVAFIELQKKKSLSRDDNKKMGDHWKRFLDGAKQFGLTPDSASKIMARTKDMKNPFDEYLNG